MRKSAPNQPNALPHSATSRIRRLSSVWTARRHSPFSTGLKANFERQILISTLPKRHKNPCWCFGADTINEGESDYDTVSQNT